MKWSRYNNLFHSDRFGHFLYNALSNTLFELDSNYYQILKNMDSDHPQISDQENTEFQDLLYQKYVFVDPVQEEKVLLAQQYQRHAASFDASTLNLAICPTLGCNFRCPYCFESSQQDKTVMTSETADQLINWVKGFQNIPALTVHWYGGEPLLAFDEICHLTRKLQTLDFKYEKNGIVTNGYLLDKDKIAELNNLNIDYLQITLDGPREVHDRRRMLSGGGPTFDRILKNIATLMDSDYAGYCIIRVNIDKSNSEGFPELRKTLMDRFKGAKFSVYPGHVDTSVSSSYDSSYCLTMNEWIDFNLDMYQKYSVLPSGGFHPGGMGTRCLASWHNGFVISPEGELYKCLNDVGMPSMVIGNINYQDYITDPGLRAQYSTALDVYNDPECRSCHVLPICGGGCPNVRLRSKCYGEEGLIYCTRFRDRLFDYLEAYIDFFRTKEICAALTNLGGTKPENKGYRIISPSNGQKQEMLVPKSW